METKYRMFYNVHKGIRNALYSTAILAGETDFNNSEEFEKLEKVWGNSLSFLRFHGHHEDRHCNKPLEAIAPGSAKHCMDDHKHIENKLHSLQSTMDKIKVTKDEDTRAELGYKFYHNFNLFISEYLHHMWDEEFNLSKVFMQNFSMEDLLQMEADIVASLTPEEKGIGLRNMLPAMTKSEIAEFLGTLRRTAPAPAFNAMAEAASRILPPEKWQAVNEKMLQEA